MYRLNYLNDVARARDCRDAISPTDDYVRRKLIMFSERETSTGYANRIKLTPNPPDTRIAFNRLLHSIRARIGEISRSSNLNQYIDACNGVDGGVDGRGASMISFISHSVMRELLTTRMVGVFCSREQMPKTLADKAAPPVFSVIPIEAIVNYVVKNEVLIKLLLKTTIEVQEKGYVTGTKTGYDEYELIDGQVTYRRYGGSLNEPASEEKVVDVSAIPFAFIQIDESPVETALQAHHALTQLSSTDFFFLNKSNYPFYVEQYDAKVELQSRQQQRMEERERVGTEDDGTPKKKKSDERETGNQTGVRYPIGAQAPSFVAPPTEHLNASEQKQAKLREQIEEVMSVDALRMTEHQQSAESKQEDKETLVGNIQLLFDMLESLEREMAGFYHAYYGVNSGYKVQYPKTFDLRSESKRLESADKKISIRDDVSSLTAKRLLTMEIIYDCLPGISKENAEKIAKEIEANNLHLSVKSIVSLLDKGGLGVDQIVTALGLPANVAKDIKQEKIDHDKAIMAAQTGNMPNIQGTGGQPPRTPVEEVVE